LELQSVTISYSFRRSRLAPPLCRTRLVAYVRCTHVPPLAVRILVWESRTKPVTQILHAMSVSVNNTAAISNGLSPGAIAGVIYGTIAGIALLLLVCFCAIIDNSLCLPRSRRNTPSIEERTHGTDIHYTGQTSVTSPGTRDASPDTSVAPPDPRLTRQAYRAKRPARVRLGSEPRDASPDTSVTLPDPRLTRQAYRAERPARVRVGSEPRDRSGAQRRGHPPTRARSQPASPPHGYLASEADTDDLIQRVRRNRGKAL
jgi:hypothetical protein